MPSTSVWVLEAFVASQDIGTWSSFVSVVRHGLEQHGIRAAAGSSSWRSRVRQIAETHLPAAAPAARAPQHRAHRRWRRLRSSPGCEPAPRSGRIRETRRNAPPPAALLASPPPGEVPPLAGKRPPPSRARRKDERLLVGEPAVTPRPSPPWVLPRLPLFMPVPRHSRELPPARVPSGSPSLACPGDTRICAGYASHIRVAAHARSRAPSSRW